MLPNDANFISSGFHPLTKFVGASFSLRFGEPSGHFEVGHFPFKCASLLSIPVSYPSAGCRAIASLFRKLRLDAISQIFGGVIPEILSMCQAEREKVTASAL